MIRWWLEQFLIAVEAEVITLETREVVEEIILMEAEEITPDQGGYGGNHHGGG